MTLMNAVIGLNLMKSQPQVLTQRKTLSNGWRKTFLISRELSLSLTRKKRSKQQRLKYQNSSNPNIDIKLQKSEDGCRNSSNLGGNSSYLNFLKTPVIWSFQNSSYLEENIPTPEIWQKCDFYCLLSIEWLYSVVAPILSKKFN